MRINRPAEAPFLQVKRSKKLLHETGKTLTGLKDGDSKFGRDGDSLIANMDVFETAGKELLRLRRAERA